MTIGLDTAKSVFARRLGAWQKRRNGAEGVLCSSSGAAIGIVKYLESRPGQCGLRNHSGR
jgi:hypothetical protein